MILMVILIIILGIFIHYKWENSFTEFELLEYETWSMNINGHLTISICEICVIGIILFILEKI